VNSTKKIDFKKEFGTLYFPNAKEVVAVKVPSMNFAIVDGQGDPNTSPDYREALEALFGVSYTLKFALKFKGVADYRVAPLESLWWTDEPGGWSLKSKEGWNWAAMVMQPGVVTRKHFRDGVLQLKERKNPPKLSKVRFERFSEGMAAQILYVGPYSAEGPTIARIHAFIQGQGYRLTGKHHEIYLGDPRRTAPDRLKTVIRQPFTR
jgi:hypothetical protein